MKLGSSSSSRHRVRGWIVYLLCFLSGWCASLLPRSVFAQSPANLSLHLYPGLSITGVLRSVHFIQYTSALSDSNEWRFLSMVHLTNSPYLYVDTTTQAWKERFYRTVQGPHDLTWIPAGTFLMGSPGNEVGRSANESPQTTVTFTKGFFMAKHEVTQGNYLSVMGTNPSTFVGDISLPVETVSWEDAMAYCARLTQSEQKAGRLPDGWTYQLPTEAQWEYACRAGTITRYSHGEDPDYTKLPSYAWFGDPLTGRTYPVGGKLANPWGLYDMHGNVWELCLDVMTYSGGSVTDPLPAGGSGRMSRGGSWHSFGTRCRSATRNSYTTTLREAWVGFRVVLTHI